MSPFRRILEFAKPYRIYFVLSIVFNVLYSLMAIVSITSILPILKILFDNVKKEDLEPIDTTAADVSLFDELQHDATIYVADLMQQYGQLTVLAWLCAVTVVMFFFRNFFRYIAQYYMIALRSGTSRDIRNAMYNKLLALPVSYFTDQRKGDIMTRISSDVDGVQRFTLMPIIEFFRAPIMIIATLAMLIFMNWKLTLAAFVILPVMGLVISTISKSLKNDTREAQKVLGNLISQVEETLSAAKIVKMFNAEKHLSTRFSDTNTQWRSLTNRVERKYELASPTSELLGSLTIIMLVWFGGKLVLEGEGLEGPAFILFLGLFFQLLDPAKALSKSFSDVSRGNASAERVFEVLDADVVVNQKVDAKPLTKFEKSIEFRNVSFSYESDQPVLKNFNLVINKGETVALVGQSGSGKTTVANLMTRFYDVTEGEILIDGTPIQDVKLDDYRALMGMVTQESVLFNDSIYNNITMGKEDATEDMVKEAAMIANAHEFIVTLPNRYYENIGESGGKLSGGQKQRLSIARAVMKNPPIMILDEATSALDTKSERLVQEALDNMMTNRTSLVIAHRLSTIQNADKIIVMDSGEIKETGEHLDLIEQNGIYANLIRMQNFG
ncbi:ABC transporter ATP-binding protein/permease [Weeksellaceae bacterium KMM 9713]|uniref:ABC transporter ATP-binding protein/permease n=1 Tax=Profundicola chukchiensis TaxID=2961959 RepID=A0A9X4RXM0_9FLAO|nr:ABC transporter ATP-binding protein [Profundicola chukchiensis]MDG4946709.1 ABC transporter ATP-binding protein/permease [Profundicola chukchiensis]